MHRIIALLFAVTVFIIPNRDSMVYFAFKWNQQVIAAEHCVNKDKPEMACRGKCYLKKTLKKAASAEKEIPLPRYDGRQLEFFHDLATLEWQVPAFDFSSDFFWNACRLQPYPTEIFIPPKSQLV